MIEAYRFGRMRIDGGTYTADVLVFPDRVKSDWWRREGHKLSVEDLDEVLQAKPEILVVGTGYYGRLKVLPETAAHLQREGISVIAEKTGDAYHTFNELSPAKRVLGAFHLTC
jgi:hypothetical protein